MKVSILIPVHNQADLTRGCLDAIRTVYPREKCEVIVVDNGSTDHTAQILELFPPNEIIRFSENRGFGDALNAAAAIATGDYLLFLNNDTELQTGAIEAMVARIETSPTIGAVGACLINPDGTLQEAGSIIWNDGTGYNYGSGMSPDHHAFEHAREVDYCSAACLLVRRSVFEKLGGFDTRFAPAYYEDTDLCFSLREIGYRVMYEPRARVIHVRGGTAGQDTTRGFKRFQEINRPNFVEKHRGALLRQPAPDLENLPRARDRRTGLRIVIIDWHVPRYDRDSGSVRMFALLRTLVDLGHQVLFIPDTLHDEQPYTRQLQDLGVEVLHGNYFVPDYLRENLPSIDLAIISRAPIGMKYLWVLRAIAPTLPIIFDTVDLHYLREERAARLTGDSVGAARAVWLRETELYLARISSRTWVVSGFEQELLERELPSAKVAIVPNVHQPRRGVPPLIAREHLVFVGSFDHMPNLDGVEWFVRDVMPLLVKRLPGVKLRIVGSMVPSSIQALASDNCEIVGQVPNVEPYLDAARVMVAPLRYGAGVKGKVGAALASGLPVVTTTIGAEGMGLVHEKSVLIADRPEEMVECIVQLYQNGTLWTQLAGAGRAIIDERYSPERLRERLREEIAAALA